MVSLWRNLMELIQGLFGLKNIFIHDTQIHIHKYIYKSGFWPSGFLLGSTRNHLFELLETDVLSSLEEGPEHLENQLQVNRPVNVRVLEADKDKIRENLEFNAVEIDLKTDQIFDYLDDDLHMLFHKQALLIDPVKWSVLSLGLAGKI